MTEGAVSRDLGSWTTPCLICVAEQHGGGRPLPAGRPADAAALIDLRGASFARRAPQDIRR